MEEGETSDDSIEYFQNHAVQNVEEVSRWFCYYALPADDAKRLHWLTSPMRFKHPETVC